MHHTLEIVLSTFIKTKWKTSGPTDPIYKRFQACRPEIFENLKDVTADAIEERESIFLTENWMKDLHGKAKALLQTMDETQMSRGDFKEFKNLVEVRDVCCLNCNKIGLIYNDIFILQFILGYTTELKMAKQLSAIHHARWMSSTIYILKMFLCQNVFEHSLKEHADIREMTKFIVFIYFFYWFKCPNLPDVPALTLNLYKDLIRWESITRLGYALH